MNWTIPICLLKAKQSLYKGPARAREEAPVHKAWMVTNESPSKMIFIKLQLLCKFGLNCIHMVAGSKPRSTTSNHGTTPVTDHHTSTGSIPTNPPSTFTL